MSRVCPILLAVAAFLAAVPLSHCQTRGIVVDRETKEPIAGVVVRQIGAQAGNEIVGVVTSSDGVFVTKPMPGGWSKLRIHSIGYRDTVIERSDLPDRAQLIRILLEPDAAQHGEVTITAQHHLAAIEDVPVSVSTVESKEIESRAPKGLDYVLRYIPGVSVTESEVNIRGASGYSRSIGSRVLLLLDGMPFLAADNGDMKFDAIPLFDVDRIEVVKGAGSALYGSSALGGVINVITRTPAEGIHGAVQSSAGMYDLTTYSQWNVPGLQRRFADVDLGGSARFDRVDVLASAGFKRNEGYRLGDDYYRWHGFAKIGSRLTDASALTVSALFANEDHGGWLYWKGLSQALEPSDSLTAINARIHSFKSNITANLTTTIGDNLLASLKLGTLHTDFTTDPRQAGDSAGSHSSANSFSIEADGSLPIASAVFLTSGLTATYQSVTSDLFQNHNGALFGAFTQAEIRPTEGLTVTAGGRGDFISYGSGASLQDGQFSPKAGISYQLLPDLTLRASYGSGFRAPTISERFTSGNLDGFTVRPDSDLKSERSNSFELGGGYSDPHWKLDAAVFYSTFDHLIEPEFVSSQSGPFIQFRNVTRAELFGHEEEVEWYPLATKDFELRLGYTYVFPRDRTTGQILKFRPRHLLQAHSEASLGGLNAGLDFRYISSYETFDTTLAVQFVPDGDKRVPIYVLDARIGYSLEESLHVPIEVTFQVLNLLNYYYVEIAGNLAPVRSYSVQIQSHF